ncbi:MAG: hypothetical protein ACK5II_01615 [Paracoccus sp. (in: a-proteobacteria)]
MTGTDPDWPDEGPDDIPEPVRIGFAAISDSLRAGWLHNPEALIPESHHL